MFKCLRDSYYEKLLTKFIKYQASKNYDFTNEDMKFQKISRWLKMNKEMYVINKYVSILYQGASLSQYFHVFDTSDWGQSVSGTGPMKVIAPDSLWIMAGPGWGR